jgi:hypothetical protein
MAMYAYKDVMRTKEFYAKDAIKQDVEIRYYCPNPNCDAHMYLCGVDGLSATYFSANRKGFSHIKGCSFGSSNSFDSNSTDEGAFDFKTAFENMMLNPSLSTQKKKSPGTHKSGDSNLKPLTTLRQIYDMCKSYACNQSYNNQKIGQMLLDDRSEYMYPKGVFGNRIIEANLRFYCPKKQEIYLVAPSSKKYEFILKVSNEKLFYRLRDSLYNNRDKFIIVAGSWESSGKFNVFQTELNSTRQIRIIK